MNHLFVPINVFVVAPAMLCWGFERLVQTACPGVRMTGTAPTLAHALRSHGPAGANVVVVDHDETVDDAVLTFAAARYPILLLTSRRFTPSREQLRQIGARGAVRKGDAVSVVLSSIKEVSADGMRHDAVSAYPPTPEADDAVPNDPDEARIQSLTVRERELIVALLSNATASGKVIANALGISEHTLRNHLTSIYAKLGVHSRLSLHAFASSHQLVDVGAPHQAGPGTGPWRARPISTASASPLQGP